MPIRTHHFAALALRTASLVTAFAVLGAGASSATNYTVTSLLDDGVGCTLRQAIEAAASDSMVGTCPAGSASDTIEIDAIGFLIFNGGEILLDPVAEGHGIDITIRSPHANPGFLVVALGTHRFLELVSGAKLTLENMTFSAGETLGRGGVVRSFNSDLTARNVTFSQNTAAVGGGAVSFVAATTNDLLIEDCSFADNDATLVVGATEGFIGGGGLLANVGASSSITIRRSEFDGNTALYPSLEYNGEGGGLYLTTFDNATARIEDTTFIDNGTQGNGALGGGARLFASDTSSIDVVDVRAIDNYIRTVNSTTSLTLGAGIQAGASTGATMTLDRILALGNGSDDLTDPAADQVTLGAVGGTVILRNALVAQGPQNGIDARSSEHLGTGGVMRLVNVTSTDNGLFGTVANRQDSSATLQIGNSLYWNNGIAGLSISGLAISILSTSTLVNPQFVDPSSDDYRLQSSSPARNAGNAAIVGIGTTDLDGNERIAEGVPDQGAYEYDSIPAGGIFSDGFESGDVTAWQ